MVITQEYRSEFTVNTPAEGGGWSWVVRQTTSPPLQGGCVLIQCRDEACWVFIDHADKGVGRGCTQFVHGRSRMTIDPRIPTMPGRSTSGFDQPGRHCLHHARSAVRGSASRMEGELDSSKNRSYDGIRHLVPTFLLVHDSANELLCFLVWPLKRQQWVLLCNCLVGALPYSHYVMRSFLCRDRFLHPAQYDLTRQPSWWPPKKKRYHGCLAYAVIGMFYSVVAHQRQPQYTYNVLQRRCQPRPTIKYLVYFNGGGGQMLAWCDGTDWHGLRRQ